MTIYTIASCDKELRSRDTAADQLVSKDYMEYATGGNHSTSWDTSFFFDLYWKKYHQTADRRQTWWRLFAPVVRKVVESSTVSPKRAMYNSIADYLNTFECTLIRSSMDVLVTAESAMNDLLWNACGVDPDGTEMPGTSWLAYIDYIRPGTAVYVIRQARLKYRKRFMDQGIDCKTAAVMACNCVISYLMTSALYDPHVEIEVDRNTVRQEAEQMYLSRLPGRAYYPDVFDHSITFESATGVRSPLMTELIQDNQERAMLQQAWDTCQPCILHKVCQPYSCVITRGMAFDDWYKEQKWDGKPLVDAGLDLYHVIQQICGIGAVPVQESAGGFVLGTMGDDSLMRSWLE